MKTFLLFIGICFLLTACVPSAPPVTSTPVAAATNTAVPTATNTSTPTVLPTFVFPTRVATITPQALPSVYSTPTGAFRFLFDDGVREYQREAIRNAAALGQSLFGDAGNVTIVAYSNIDALIQEQSNNYKRPVNSQPSVESRFRFLEGVKSCDANEGVIFCYITPSNPALGTSVYTAILHEYFHNVQFYLTRTRTSSAGAAWLIEGSAEYARTWVDVRYGLTDWETQRKRWILQTRGITRPLSSMETVRGSEEEDFIAKYSLGYLAVEYLVANVGEQAVLKKYWEWVGSGLGWPIALEKAFGIPLNTFYERFEEYRQVEFPPYCDYWSRGSFGIQFNRSLAAGSIPGVAPEFIPYIFCVTGYSMIDLPPAQRSMAFKLPNASARRGSCAANCIIIYMPKSLPFRDYLFAFVAADGRHAEATFPHGPQPVTATPKP